MNKYRSFRAVFCVFLILILQIIIKLLQYLIINQLQISCKHNNF